MARLRSNFQRGSLSANIGSSDTALNSNEFSALPVVASPDFLMIVLDPDAVHGNPEIVKVTAHTSSATAVTATRAQEGTSVRAHNSSTAWRHVPDTADWAALRATTTDKVVYVSGDSSASDNNDGLSWGSGKATIAGAVTALGASGGRIEVGAGAFNVSSTITIGLNGPVHLRGRGQRVTHLSWTGGASPLIKVDATDGHDSIVEDLNLQNTTTATVGIQVNAVRVTIRRVGYINSAVKFSTAIISTYQAASHCYDTLIHNCYLSEGNSGAETPVAIDFAGGHTATVDACMLSGFPIGVQSRISGGSLTSLFGLSVVNCRIEAFNGTAPGYSGGATAVGVITSDTFGVSIVGTNFEMASDGLGGSSGQRAIKLGANTFAANVHGCHINGNGVITLGIEFTDSTASGIEIRGNSMYRINGNAIGVSGTGKLTNAEIGYNNTSSVTKLFDNSWTPTITFGGASTGITYGTQRGRWERRGNFILATATIGLSSKGSSTGAARVNGLPLISLNETGNTVTGSITPFTMSGTPVICPDVEPNATQIRLYKLTTGSECADTDFLNSTYLEITVEYQVAL